MESSIPRLQSYFKRKADTKWRQWLNEDVYIDIRKENSVAKRYEALLYFFQKGIVPFVKDHGYNLRLDVHLASEFANFLYQGLKDDFREQSFYRQDNVKYKMDIDYDYYTMRGIPEEDWTVFWETWQWMSDFYDEKFRNRYLLPNFIYSPLDLETSEVTEKITRELEEADELDEHLPIVEQASDAIGQGKDKNSLY